MGGLYLAHYVQVKNPFVNCMSSTDFMEKPDRPVSDQTKSRTGVHLGDLGLRLHYLQERSVCVYYE